MHMLRALISHLTPSPVGRCQCVDGYEGYFCEDEINECVTATGADVCLNGATCTDRLLNFTCTCADGYTGT